MKYFLRFVSAEIGCGTPIPAVTGDFPAVVLIQSRKLRDRAGHNAFNDLVHFQNRWYGVWRGSRGLVS